jgi:hypothetical protein
VAEKPIHIVREHRADGPRIGIEQDRSRLRLVSTKVVVLPGADKEPGCWRSRWLRRIGPTIAIRIIARTVFIAEFAIPVPAEDGTAVILSACTAPSALNQSNTRVVPAR